MSASMHASGRRGRGPQGDRGRQELTAADDDHDRDGGECADHQRHGDTSSGPAYPALMTQTADHPVPTPGAEIPTFRLFIAGEWVESVGGETFESVNPADRRDVIGRFQAGTKADAAMAIKAAEMALPRWKATPAPKRGEILYAFAELMARHKERLARAMTREMGKVIAEARGDVQEGIDIAYLMAGEGRRMFGDTVPSELPDKWAMSIRQPIGIAGIITPWNFPIAIPCWKMMPALVTGNTVVFKPASDTPHCATLLVELMAEAGFPPGVVNLVTGGGGEVGDAIVESPDVPVISFTGHASTGKAIAERAARRLKRVSLELGGKNGVVVLADADLDLATDGILWSAFGTTGQRCTACSRVIVERTVVEPLLERLERRAKALRLGYGLDEAVDVGPLINPAAVDKVGSYVEIGRVEGDLVLGGHPATDGHLAHGNFFEPTIFANVMPMDRIGQEEIFGPVLSVVPVDDFDAAITALNQTRYGLSASIFTRDVNRAFRAMRDFETGIVYVNAGTTGAETHLPFGGWKETGNGHREAGHAALDSYTEWKSIYVDFSGRLQRAQIDNQSSLD
jgi:aldehyde dehydrogenase (NAD+)